MWVNGLLFGVVIVWMMVLLLVLIISSCELVMI